jgi:hypothetical protein
MLADVAAICIVQQQLLACRLFVLRTTRLRQSIEHIQVVFVQRSGQQGRRMCAALQMRLHVATLHGAAPRCITTNAVCIDVAVGPCDADAS